MVASRGYGKRRPLLDPYGIPHPEEAVGFLKQLPSITVGSAQYVSRHMIETLALLARERPLQVQRMDAAGHLV